MVDIGHDAIEPRTDVGNRFQHDMRHATIIDIDRLFPIGGRLIVVAPHPDDEVLGCGGIIAAAVEWGQAVILVGVTDGEACYPESRLYSAAHLAAIRRAETMEALRRLGVVDPAVVHLALPDGGVRKHVAQLVQKLRALIRPDDVVVTTWRHDGHCDHEAVGDAVAEAVIDSGATLLEVPVWAWHWPGNEQTHAQVLRARRIELAPRWLLRKRRALAAFSSQLRPRAPFPKAPVLTQNLLSNWLLPWETVFV